MLTLCVNLLAFQGCKPTMIRLMAIRPMLVGLALALFAVTPALAQQAARVEFSGGYALLTAGSETYPKGYYADLVGNVNSWLGIVAATDGAYRSQSFEYPVVGREPGGTIIRDRVPVTLNTTTRGFVLGARLRTPRDARVRFFAQVLGGAARLSTRADVNASAESAAALRDAYHSSAGRTAVQAGGGANIAISSRIAARAGIDYRRLERVPSSLLVNGDSGRGPNQLMFTLGAAWMRGN